jgi:hypothetical protein
VTIQPVDAEGVVAATVSGLAFNASGYLAVKATDNVGNVGPLSESLEFSVLQVRKVYENTTDTLDGATADAPWGLEDLNGGKVFSDSPAGNYADNANVSLTLAPIELDSPLATLVVTSSWDLESGYDFATVEVSADQGATWVTLDQVSGSSNGMQQRSYDLAPVLGDRVSFLLRFHLKADYSINYDGLKVDDVQIFGPASN